MSRVDLRTFIETVLHLMERQNPPIFISADARYKVEIKAVNMRPDAGEKVQAS